MPTKADMYMHARGIDSVYYKTSVIKGHLTAAFQYLTATCTGWTYADTLYLISRGLNSCTRISVGP